MEKERQWSGQARIQFVEAHQREELEIRIEPQLHGATFGPGDWILSASRSDGSPETTMNSAQRRELMIVEALRGLAKDAYITVMAQGLTVLQANSRPSDFEAMREQASRLADLADEKYREWAEAEMKKKEEANARLTKANEILSARLDEARLAHTRSAFVASPPETISRLEQTHPRLRGERDFHRRLMETDATYSAAHMALQEQHGEIHRATTQEGRDFIVDLARRRQAGQHYAQKEVDGSWSVYRNGGFVRGKFPDAAVALAWGDGGEENR